MGNVFEKVMCRSCEHLMMKGTDDHYLCVNEKCPEPMMLIPEQVPIRPKRKLPEPRKTLEVIIEKVPVVEMERLRSILEEVLQNDDELPANLPFEFHELVAYDDDFRRQYNDPECECGHPYHRHFDSYEVPFEPVGCKYCPCREWSAPK